MALLPAVTGGFLLMLVLSAGLGRWQIPALLLWLGVPAVVAGAEGEALAVRVLLGWRPPSETERRLLKPAADRALSCSALPADAFDWYVTRPDRAVNAYAAGRRSIAVTPTAVQECLAGRLPAALLAAILTHEIGHHADGTNRHDLTVRWLAAPGRLALRLVQYATTRLCGRAAGPWTRTLLTIMGAAALIEALRQEQWPAALVLAGLCSGCLLIPPAEAALARAGEHVADRYARDAGVGPDLAEALRRLAQPDGGGSRLTRLLDDHPRTADRIARLTAPLHLNRAS